MSDTVNGNGNRDGDGDGDGDNDGVCLIVLADEQMKQGRHLQQVGWLAGLQRGCGRKKKERM